MRKYSWIPIFVLITICVGCISSSAAAQNLEMDSESFRPYMVFYLLQSDGFEDIDRIPAFFAIFPVLVFSFFNGTNIYEKWNDTGIYIISRKRRRATAFLQDAVRLAGWSVVGSAIYIAVPILYAHFILKQAFVDWQMTSISLFILNFALFYFLALLQNIVSMIRGSTYGIIIVTILFLTFASISMALISNADTVAVKMLSLVIPFISLYACLQDCYSFGFVIFSVLFNFVFVTVIGMTLVKKIDIGISNKEFI